MDFNEWKAIWASLLGVVAAMAIAGNIVTIAIFLKRQLLKRPHFLLISLAAAALLVGLVAIPLYMLIQFVYYEYYTKCWGPS